MTQPSAPSGSEPPQGDRSDGELRRKARLGAIALAVRSVLLEGLVLTGNLVLAQVLDPADFGVFAISQFALAFFAFFGDAGLGGGLVQQRESPSETILSSVFWLQVLIASGVIAAVWVSAPLVRVVWPDLPRGTEWLMRALSLELLLTAARTVPSLLMERELQFRKLSIIEVTNQVAYYAAALPLGALGYGTKALVGGVLARAFTGVILAYSLRPWRPRTVLDWHGLRPIVHFGIPYQLKNVVGFANGAVMPVYAGHALGAHAVGIIGWSQTTAYTPLKLVEVMGRVGFPLYSRLQHKPRLIAETLGRSVHVCAAGTFLFAGIIFGLGPELVRIAYPKWGEAMVPLYLYSGAISIGFLTPLVAAAFDAMGRPKVFLQLSIGWTLLAWAVVPFTTPRWGIVGFVGGFIVHTIVGNLVVLGLVMRVFPEARVVRRSAGVAVAAVVEALVARFAIARFVDGPFTLVFGLVGCALCFVAVVSVVDRTTLTDVLSLLRSKGPSDAGAAAEG